MFLWKHMFWVLLDVYLEIELLSHDNFMCNVWDTIKLILITNIQFYLPTSNVKKYSSYFASLSSFVF